jgi:RNA polymerase sigma factor (sigma-70 family)
MTSSGSAVPHAASDVLEPLREITPMFPDTSDHSHQEVRGIVAKDLRLIEIETYGRQCKDGDWASWDSLFQSVWPVLVTFVHRLYRSFDEQDAEDVAQATIEAAIKGIQTFSGKGLFRAWLFGIASKQASTFVRRNWAKKRGAALLVPLDDSIDCGDGRAKSPADASEENDRAAILHRAIEELNEDDRDLIHLHFFGELTFREIGQARNMNPKTVCTRLNRCKEKLLALLLRSNLTSSNG